MIDETRIYKRIVDMYRPFQRLVGVPFMLGGGCIGDVIAFGKVIKDYDIFFKTYDDMHMFEQRIRQLGFKFVGESDTVRQYEFLNIHLDVVTWQVKPTAYDFIRTFDFTVNAVILDGNALHMHTRTLQDCVNKIITPVRTLDLQYQYRIKRYMDKGYTVDPTSALYGILYDRTNIDVVDVNYEDNMQVDPLAYIQVDLSQY